MIVVRIWEGLGNQLFQYAYARSLQLRTGLPIYLDIRHRNRGDIPYEKADVVKRRLGIQHFNIPMKRIDTRKISGLRCLDNEKRYHQLQYNLKKNGLGRWHLLDDEDNMTDICPDILSPRDFSYISAHCLNRDYFKDSRDILLQEPQLKRGIKLSDDLGRILKNKNTVSIHIRLTDYLRHPAVLCRQDYYNAAIQYVRTTIPNPYFIVFTDDPQMARKRYEFQDNVYWISDDGYKDYEELDIMSRCRHNILARSTFGYWGAWLNQNPEKLVIVPRRWLGGRLYEKNWKVF